MGLLANLEAELALKKSELDKLKADILNKSEDDLDKIMTLMAEKDQLRQDYSVEREQLDKLVESKQEELSKLKVQLEASAKAISEHQETIKTLTKESDAMKQDLS